MLLRTENIAEDERFYKAISGLDDKTGQETIEHGNASPRKCELKSLLGSLLRFDNLFFIQSLPSSSGTRWRRRTLS